MEPAEYQRIGDLEDTYWWYRAQRATVIEAIKALPLPEHPQVLDAGCGTGGFARRLSETLGVRVMGFDLFVQAAAFWSTAPAAAHNGHRPELRCRATADAICFDSDTFDLVTSIDLLQAIELNPDAACKEMCRVIKPGGFLVLVAPAYQWMRSEHDRAVHSVRRFSRRSLRSQLTSAGFRVRRMTHLFASLLGPIAAVRLARQITTRHNGRAAESDLRPLPGVINAALEGWCAVGRRVVRHIDMPFGSSILAVVQKEGH